MVGIDPAGESEDVARELALGGGDRGVDRIVPLGVDQRIDVAGVVGPGFAIRSRRAVESVSFQQAR